jgi:hypothetical protein
VNAEFNWWLLIVGLVLGAALTWLVMAESTRRDADLTEREQRGEARWIALMLRSIGRPTDSADVDEILQLHRQYLAAPPPDDPGPDDVVTDDDAEAPAAEPVREVRDPAAPPSRAAGEEG